MRACHSKHPMLMQHVFGKPLRAGNIRQIAVKDGFNHVHAALGNIANHIHIGAVVIQLRCVKAFVYADAERFQLRAHGRIHFGVAACYFEACLLGDGGESAHKCAADADDVDVFHDVFGVSTKGDDYNANAWYRRWRLPNNKAAQRA